MRMMDLRRKISPTTASIHTWHLPSTSQRLRRRKTARMVNPILPKKRSHMLLPRLPAALPSARGFRKPSLRSILLSHRPRLSPKAARVLVSAKISSTRL